MYSILHSFGLASLLWPEILKRKLTVCTANLYNQSVAEGQQIAVMLANSLPL